MFASFFCLEPIINYPRTALNDIPNGQSNMDLISQLGLPYPGDGYGMQNSPYNYQGYQGYGNRDLNAASYPDNNPKTSQGAKKLPLELVPPSATHALAEAFADGAKKYGPYNWRDKTISSSIYYGAAMRHLSAWWDGEDLAEDSGINHLHHALACIAMVVDGQSVGKLNDNRPSKGAAGKMQKDWLKKAANDTEFNNIETST